MIEEKKEKSEALSKKSVLKLKGQAVPLFSYHIIRDHVLTSIVGEYQTSILYWAGKNLANQFELSTLEECIDMFLELGWGYLEKGNSNLHVQRFSLNSPFFISRNILENESTFALECGFLAQTLANIEQKDTEGEFKLITKQQEASIQISIYFQEKEKRD
jgi:predicted hydrocarbon binding protein